MWLHSRIYCQHEGLGRINHIYPRWYHCQMEEEDGNFHIYTQRISHTGVHTFYNVTLFPSETNTTIKFERVRLGKYQYLSSLKSEL